MINHSDEFFFQQMIAALSAGDMADGNVPCKTAAEIDSWIEHIVDLAEQFVALKNSRLAANPIELKKQSGKR